MKTDIVLAGVGGQGILSIATILGAAALKENLYLKQAEVHGMSQRGGDVSSNLRLSSEPIASDLIPLGGADLIVSLEPMEGLRYLPYLSKNGWIVTNTAPFVNIPDYPEQSVLENELANQPNVVAFGVDELAKEVASQRASNVGRSSELPRLSSTSNLKKIEEGIRIVFGKKGEAIVESNIKAFRAGLEKAKSISK